MNVGREVPCLCRKQTTFRLIRPLNPIRGPCSKALQARQERRAPLHTKPARALGGAGSPPPPGWLGGGGIAAGLPAVLPDRPQSIRGQRQGGVAHLARLGAQPGGAGAVCVGLDSLRASAAGDAGQCLPQRPTGLEGDYRPQALPGAGVHGQICQQVSGFSRPMRRLPMPRNGCWSGFRGGSACRPCRARC